MRFLVLWLGPVSLLMGQTVVTGRLVTPTGDLVSGRCTILPVGAPWQIGSNRVTPSGVSFDFNGGKFSVALLPTDHTLPSGAHYSASCVAPAQTVGARRIEAATWPARPWFVPTSGTPVDLSVVEAPNPHVDLTGVVNLTQLNWAGLGNGCFAIQTGIATVFPCAPYLVGRTISQMTSFTISQL